MLLGAVAQAQNFAITATTEAAIRKNIVKGNAANYGFGMINDTLKLVGLTTRNVIFTGSTSKTDIGLSNVDNTSDANKPISTATQTALNLKANIASPTFTGTVNGITKSMVGLGSVDNTTDEGKPISTATQTALDAKQATLSGIGFVKATSGTISYDNSTYLSTSTAASTYLPIANPTATGTLTAPTITNSLGANFATTSGNVGIGTTSPSSILHTIGTIQTSSTSSASSSYATRFNNIIFSRSDIPTTYTNAISNSWSGTTIDQTMNFEVGSGASTRVTAMTLLGNGNVGIGTTTPATKFTVNGNVGIGTTTDAGYKLDVNGTARASQFYLSALNTAPASATATGTVGEIRVDASYIYICTATNTWKRSAITTW